MSSLDGLITQIKDKREERKNKGLRTTEATEEIFKIKRYDWTADPKGFRKETEDGSIPLNRCVHCGYRYVGWKLAAPFCNICHLAHVGKSIISVEQRAWIGSHVRIPEGESELDHAIRQKKREADDIYNRKKPLESVKSDFKRSIDLA